MILPIADDPILGRVVMGCYVVEKRLGQGGMGAVYRLKHEDPRLGLFAALKVMSAQAARDERLRERFQQEAYVAAKIGSHRVVKPLHLGTFDDGIAYIVMEYVPGRSLAEVLAETGPLAVARALAIAARVADTMAVCHEAAILHRDLKPPNVMLFREGATDDAVKVIDFGIARASGEIKLAVTDEGRSAMGTPGYWSPECVAGKVLDGRSDVFSLGVVLFKMLTGRAPFRCDTVENAMLSVLDKTPAPLVSALRPPGLDPVPPDVDELVARALEKNRDERFDMALLRGALVGALDRHAAAALHGAGSVVLPEHRAKAAVPTLSGDSAPLLIDVAALGGQRGSAATMDGPHQPTPAAAAAFPSTSPDPPRRVGYAIVAVAAALGLGAVVGLVVPRRASPPSLTPAPPPAAPARTPVATEPQPMAAPSPASGLPAAIPLPTTPQARAAPDAASPRRGQARSKASAKAVGMDAGANSPTLEGQSTEPPEMNFGQ